MKRLTLITVVLAVLVCLLGLSPAQAERDILLEETLMALVRNTPVRVGIAVKNISTGQEAYINGDEAYPMSSVFKIPILVELYRQKEQGQVDLSRQISIKPGDIRFGSGLIKDLSPGLKLTLYDLAVLMISVSDNSATDMLLNIVTIEKVQHMLDSQRLNIQIKMGMGELFQDLPHRLFELAREKNLNLSASGMHGMDREKIESLWIEAGMELSRRDPNLATPRSMNQLLELILTGELLTPRAREEVLEILQSQKLKSRLPYMLPDMVVTAHKTGYYPSVTNDVGIIYITDKQPVIVSVFTKDNDQLPQYEMKLLIARVGKLVYDHYRK